MTRLNAFLDRVADSHHWEIIDRHPRMALLCAFVFFVLGTTL